MCICVCLYERGGGQGRESCMGPEPLIDEKLSWHLVLSILLVLNKELLKTKQGKMSNRWDSSKINCEDSDQL